MQLATAFDIGYPATRVAQSHLTQAAQRAEIEKIRLQKRKRSRRAKDRMLAGKSHHAAKKASRRPVGAE